jgi:Mg2+ and Co2+ transporter CorA
LTPQEIGSVKDPHAFVWLDVLDIEDFEIGPAHQRLNLHPLTIEDFIMPNARPKIEKFNEYIFSSVSLASSPDNGARER